MGFDENARTVSNQSTIAKRLGFYGIMTLGVGVLIVSGGIDLSIGSVVGLGAIVYGTLLIRYGMSPILAALLVLAMSSLIGLFHGLLVTRLKLQPFLVTLCGLFIYRGLARLVDPTAGLVPNVLPKFKAPFGYFGTWVCYDLSNEEEVARFKDKINFFRTWMVGDPLGVPQQLILLLLVAVLLGLFLHRTSHGRYLFAIGANDQAARYAGIPTDRYKILAYLICSTLAGLASVLEILDSRSAQATSAGQLYELYAITGAVLGGCSLSGGEGTIPGMFLGAAVLPLLRQVVSFSKLANELEYVVIGIALLLGTITDEILKRRSLGRGG
jgi:ribose transport system permease protein